MSLHGFFDVVFRFTRPRRMRSFAAHVAPGEREPILDVGGTAVNWRYLPAQPPVVLVNLKAPRGELPGDRMKFLEADARALPFRDRAFPIVFSNSTIEHVGGWDDQQAFARELRRVGQRVWVQTPARVFPVEPHYLTIGLHWLPPRWQKRVLPYLSLVGWIRLRKGIGVDDMVDGIRLITRREMAELFPDCEILVERFLFWPKSYIAVRRA